MQRSRTPTKQKTNPSVESPKKTDTPDGLALLGPKSLFSPPGELPLYRNRCAKTSNPYAMPGNPLELNVSLFHLSQGFEHIRGLSCKICKMRL